VKDIENIQSSYIAFCDENLLNYKKYAFELLNHIKIYGKQYLAQLDPHSALDEEVAKMLGEASIKIALVGFESVNPENFLGNPKYIPPSEWGKIVKNLHKYGVKVNGSFIIGFDNDGPDVFEKTLKIIQEAEIDIPTFTILTPYPGTRLYNRLLREERIIDNDWGNYDLYHVVFKPKLLTPQELLEGVGYLRKNTKSPYQYAKNYFETAA
jgi:radical SAM superfamily enzyme YgiQ (UPF0313 family)